MSWQTLATANPGQYLLGSVTSGVNLNVVFGVTANDIMRVVQERAVGWTPIQVLWEPGTFGFGESLAIQGRATDYASTSVVAAQIADAINSFWSMAGASCSVQVSDTSTLPPRPTTADDWAVTLKWGAIAVLAVAIVYGINQLRRTFQ